jgi:hypothetical protein
VQQLKRLLRRVGKIKRADSPRAGARARLRRTKQIPARTQ